MRHKKRQKKPKEPSVFSKCVHKLEILFKKVITFRGTHPEVEESGKVTKHRYGNFICDSHPAVCRVCVNIRSFLKHGKFPIYMAITTRRGLFLYFKQDTLIFHMKPKNGLYVSNFDAMYGTKIKIPWKILRSRELPVLVKRIYYFPSKIKESAINE